MGRLCSVAKSSSISEKMDFPRNSVGFTRNTKARFTQQPNYANKSLLSNSYEGQVIRKRRVIKKLDFTRSKFGGRHLVTLLPGAPPGPKFMSYVKDVFECAYVPIFFEEVELEPQKEEDGKHGFLKNALLSLTRNRVGLKGNIEDPNLQKGTNAVLNQQLDLYVSVLHVKGFASVKCKYPDLDLYLCRQNTEGEYAMLEHSALPGLVESLKIITKENTQRFAEFCFDFAQQENRKKITIVHKANIMKISDGLFVRVIRDVAKKFPNIEVNDIIIDNATMQLVQNPKQFDILVTPNLYGNILASIACGLTSGAGILSARNYGPNCAMFEAGLRQLSFTEFSNPISTLKATVSLLNYLDLKEHALLIRDAIIKTILEDKIHTADMGGTNTDDQVFESIKKNVLEMREARNISTF